MDSTSSEISIDGEVVTICGIRYSMDIFRQLGGALPLGKWFRLESRDNDVLALHVDDRYDNLGHLNEATPDDPLGLGLNRIDYR